MQIGGFQRFSLLDYPGQLAAIVFTQGCNFRCPYCHNPQLVNPEKYSTPIPEHEVLAFLETRRGKLGAVTITGGEPTLHRDLIDFLKAVKKMGYLIKLDTNGSNPDVLIMLSQMKLIDYWAMDIKAPLHLYPVVSKNDLDPKDILRSMDIIRNSGTHFEFRTTFFEALFNWNDLSQIKELLCPGDTFYLQQCRYTDTLEPVQPSVTANISLSDYHYLHLIDHPSCKNLQEWGETHNVQVNIRSF